MGPRIVIAVMVLLLGACGASEDVSSNQVPTDVTAASDIDDVVGEVTDGTDGGDVIEQAEEQFDAMVDTEGGTATVTIGAQTWEFQAFESIPIVACDADFFGGFFVVLTDGDDIAVPLNQMSITLPGGDFQDPPQVTVTINVDGDASWIADETIYEQNADLPEGIGVSSFAIDGATATGTALFYEEESYFQFNAGNGDLVLEEGSFTVTCPAA